VPDWLVAALGMVGGAVGLGGRSEGGGLNIPGVTGQGIPFLPAVLDPFEPGGFDIFANRPVARGGVRRRRRRRQALTQGDRNAIAFIAATVSKRAAGEFAVQLVTRSR